MGSRARNPRVPEQCALLALRPAERAPSAASRWRVRPPSAHCFTYRAVCAGLPLELGLDYLLLYATGPLLTCQLVRRPPPSRCTPLTPPPPAQLFQTQNDIASLPPAMRFRTIGRIFEHVAWGKASWHAIWCAVPSAAVRCASHNRTLAGRAATRSSCIGACRAWAALRSARPSSRSLITSTLSCPGVRLPLSLSSQL